MNSRNWEVPKYLFYHLPKLPLMCLCRCSPPQTHTHTHPTPLCPYLFCRREKNIPGGEITVNESSGLEVAHPGGNLDGVLAQGGHQVPMTVLTQPVNQGAEGGKLRHLAQRMGGFFFSSPILLGIYLLINSFIYLFIYSFIAIEWMNEWLVF